MIEKLPLQFSMHEAIEDKINELIEAYNTLEAKYEKHRHELRGATSLGGGLPRGLLGSTEPPIEETK